VSLGGACPGVARGGTSSNNSNSPWALAQSLAWNPLGDNGGGGLCLRCPQCDSPVSSSGGAKLAQPVSCVLIASSVMVNARRSVFKECYRRARSQIGGLCLSLKPGLFCVSLKDFKGSKQGGWTAWTPKHMSIVIPVTGGDRYPQGGFVLHNHSLSFAICFRRFTRDVTAKSLKGRINDDCVCA